MCGRFVQSQSPNIYAEFFGADVIKTEELKASYNVAPTDPVYAIAEHDDQRILGTFKWGSAAVLGEGPQDWRPATSMPEWRPLRRSHRFGSRSSGAAV